MKDQERDRRHPSFLSSFLFSKRGRKEEVSSTILLFLFCSFSSFIFSSSEIETRKRERNRKGREEKVL